MGGITGQPVFDRELRAGFGVEHILVVVRPVGTPPDGTVADGDPSREPQKKTADAHDWHELRLVGPEVLLPAGVTSGPGPRGSGRRGARGVWTHQPWDQQSRSGAARPDCRSHRGWNRPDAGGESEGLHFRQPNRPRLHRTMRRKACSALATLFSDQSWLPLLRFDCGTEDPLPAANRALYSALAAVPHQCQEFPGAHAWDYWQTHVADTLKFFATALARTTLLPLPDPSG
jgi:hypothetical protein